LSRRPRRRPRPAPDLVALPQRPLGSLRVPARPRRPDRIGRRIRDRRPRRGQQEQGLSRSAATTPVTGVSNTVYSWKRQRLESSARSAKRTAHVDCPGECAAMTASLETRTGGRARALGRCRCSRHLCLTGPHQDHEDGQRRMGPGKGPEPATGGTWDCGALVGKPLWIVGATQGKRGSWHATAPPGRRSRPRGSQPPPKSRYPWSQRPGKRSGTSVGRPTGTTTTSR